MKYTLTVTQKPSGSFAHVVTDETGKIIGRRVSANKHYHFALVVDDNRPAQLRYYSDMLKPGGAVEHGWYSRDFVEKRVQELEDAIARGFSRPGILRWNSKLTPLTARETTAHVFIAIASDLVS